MQHDFDFYTNWCMCGVGVAEQMSSPSECTGIAGPPRRKPVEPPTPPTFDPARSLRNMLRGFLETPGSEKGIP